MRIAVLADPLDNQNAGVHSYTVGMVRALLERDDDHEYILVRERYDAAFASVKQIILRNIGLPLGFASVRLFLLVPLLLRYHRVDAVIEPAHFGPFNLPRRVKRVTAIHDLTPILHPQLHRWHSQFLQRLFLPGILRRADLILSNSRSTTSDLERVFPQSRGKICTIYLGRPNSLELSDIDVRQKYQLANPYFLHVGTLEPRKNLLTLLHAYEIFRRESDENTSLVLVGPKGWKSKAFFERLAQHPYRSEVKILGFVPRTELNQLYSNCVAMVYCSQYEGFGLPIIEAMSLGARVICANNSSLPEVGGVHATYFDTMDVRDLAKELHQALQSPIDPIKLKEAKHWTEQFSWTSYADQLVRALESC